MSLEDRQSAIRAYLVAADFEPALSGRYATVAARWEQVRYAQARGSTTPGDDIRLRELASMVQALGARLGLGDAITRNGWLPRDPARIIRKDWLDNAETYFA